MTVQFNKADKISLFRAIKCTYGYTGLKFWNFFTCLFIVISIGLAELFTIEIVYKIVNISETKKIGFLENILMSLVGKDYSENIIFLVYGLAFAILGGVKIFGMRYQINFVENCRSSISERIASKLFLREYGYLNNVKGSEKIKIILNETDTLADFVVQPSLRFVTSLFIVTLLFGNLFLKEPKATIFASVAILFGYMIIYFLFSKNVEISSTLRVQANEKRFELISNLVGNLKTIKFEKNEKRSVENFRVYANAYANATANNYFFAQSPRIFLETFAFIALFALLLALTNDKDNQAQFLAQVTLLGVSGYRMLPAVQGIYSSLITFKTGKRSLQAIEKIVGEGPSNYEEIEMTQKEAIQVTKIRSQGFSYSFKNSKLIFPPFCFEKGKKYLIDGESGSGKTTFIECLTGLRKGLDGEIELIFSDGSQKNGNLTRHQTVYVPQDIYLGNQSINNYLAIEKSRIDEVHAVLLKLGLIKNNDSLSDYLAKIIVDEGKNISGGQKQRLGIARALLSDKNILIFDESFNAVEEHLRKKIAKFLLEKKEKTIIVISHDEEVKALFDNVYTIDLFSEG